jgi:hypothetical protein
VHGLTEQGHVDDPAPGRRRSVPTDDRDVVLGCEGLDARIEPLRVLDDHRLRAGQRDQAPPRASAHRCDVREVHCERFPADVHGRGPAAAEVHVLDEQIGGGQQEAPRGRLQHRAVVTDSYPNRRRPPGRPPDDLDQASLGHCSGLTHPERKFLRSCFPSIVRMDSGWNWTPSTGSRRWRRPMISPSSAHAVTSSASGTVSRMTASE